MSRFVTKLRMRPPSFSTFPKESQAALPESALSPQLPCKSKLRSADREIHALLQRLAISLDTYISWRRNETASSINKTPSGNIPSSEERDRLLHIILQQTLEIHELRNGKRP